MGTLSRRTVGHLGLPLLALVLSGCLDSGGSNSDELDQQLRDEIESRGLTGEPAMGLMLQRDGDMMELPDINSNKAQLGKLLFFSTVLGGDEDVACATCHHPVLGGGDDLSLPIGTEAVDPSLLGPGRLHRSDGQHFDGGPTVPRNAPTTFNLGFWNEVLFHDGRLQSLNPVSGENGAAGAIRTPDSAHLVADNSAGANLAVAQARFPVTSAEEMRGFDFAAGLDNQALRDLLAQRLRSYPGWLEPFQAVYGEGSAEDVITFANVVDAIGHYERSQVFTDSPWRAYVYDSDDSALTDEAKRGALLFLRSVDEGGAGCASCHSGDFFTDEQFHNIAMVQIGRGKGDGVRGTGDFGRFRETGDERDLYAFRTPSLLNVEATGPWGHAGAYHSLEAVIRHHLDPEGAIANYDVSPLVEGEQTEDTALNSRRAFEALEQVWELDEAMLEPVGLTAVEVAELAAFLRALTDPCVKSRACLAPWIPDEADPDPDGMRLRAIDQDGNPL